MEERREFPKGAIVRIRCCRFLTYREVTINPGPRLNVVIGPNGTGKSSIVCAIALGLGAHTRLLGRSENLGEFVMQGHDDGFVEIELFRGEGRPNSIIKRCLVRGKNSSEWILDGKKSTEKIVQALVERTGAQVGNLCTFLPQEKVGEFSGFDSVQLLQECEKAVGGPDLFRDHQNLTKMESELGQVERQIESKQKRVEELQEQNKALERDREKMEQREQHLKMVDLCEKRLLWVAFEEGQAAVVAVRDQRDAAIKDLQESEARLAPLKDQAKAAKAALMKQDKKVEGYTKESDPLRKQYDQAQAKVGAALEKVEGYKEEIDNLSVREKEAARKVKDASKALAHKQAVLEKHDGEAVKREVGQLKDQLKEATEAYFTSEDERMQVFNETKKANQEVKNAKHALDALGDANGKRVASLRQAGRQGDDAVRLREWLDQEGNRGNFRRPVHGPVALELDVVEPKYMDLLEQQISWRVMTGFVTECEEDYRKLKQVLAQQKMSITCFDINQGKLKDTAPSHSPQQLAALEGMGFLGFLEGAVQCPDAIKQLVRDHSNLHRCLIGDERMMRAFNENRQATQKVLMGNLKGGFQGFMQNPDGRWSQMGGRASAYQNGEVSISIKQVNGKRFLQEGEDPRERLAREAVVADKQALFAAGKDKHDELKRASDGVKLQKEKLSTHYEQRRKDLSIGKRLATDIASYQNKLEAAQVEAQQLDVDKERKVLVKKVSMSVNKRLECLEAAQQTLVLLLDLEAKLGLSKLGLELAKDAFTAKKRRLEEEEQSLQGKADLVVTLKSQFKQDKDKLKQVRKAAEDGAAIFATDPDTGEKVDTPLRAEMEGLPIDRATVVANRDASSEAAANIHDNPQVIVQYNGRKAEVAKLEAEISAIQGSDGGARASFEALKDKWTSAIRTTAEKLNVLFASYMGQLQYSGLCQVHEEGNQFDKWGLNLLVSYRQGQAPVLLKKTVQSGGERSVATIMFLMALQDMVKSPFRVVDEINQGMDERNERLVFKRIVENSVGATRPQYFLITPKLLQGLTAMDHEDVTVLFVFNGPWNLAKPQQWDLENFFDVAASNGAGGAGKESRALTDDPNRKRRVDNTED